MNNAVSYAGVYEDKFGVVDVVIHNNFEELSLKIEGVEFVGSEFSALEIINKQSYASKQLERFTLCRTRIFGTDNFVEHICNCTFSIKIPQFIICLKTKKELVIKFNVKYMLGDKIPAPLSDGITYEKNKLVISYFGRIVQ